MAGLLFAKHVNPCLPLARQYLTYISMTSKTRQAFSALLKLMSVLLTFGLTAVAPDHVLQPSAQ